MFSNLGTPYNFLVPTSREQGNNQIINRPTFFNNAEKSTIPTLSQLQAIQPGVSSISESTLTGADVESYSLGSEISVGSTIFSRRYERVPPMAKPAQTPLDKTMPFIWQYNTTGWTPMRSLMIEFPINYLISHTNGYIKPGSSKQEAMTFFRLIYQLQIWMGNNSLLVSDTYPMDNRKNLHSIIREKTIREVNRFYAQWGTPFDNLISSADFNRTNPDNTTNEEFFFAGEDYSNSIFARAQNAYMGTYYGPQEFSFPKINYLPLFLLYPEFDTDMLLPPGFPIKIQLNLNSDYFDGPILIGEPRSSRSNYFPTRMELKVSQSSTNGPSWDLFFLRATSLIVNNQTNASWMSALQNKPFIFTVPAYSFNQQVYGDGTSTNFSFSLQPVAMIPLKIVIEPINMSLNTYYFLNPAMSEAYSGGSNAYNTDCALGEVKPYGYLPYIIERIQVVGQSGEQYYIYQNEILTQFFNSSIQTTHDAYETYLEHEELCERNPLCPPEGLHRNRLRCFSRSQPFIVDLSNNTSGYRGATNISMNQLKAEQLTVNITIKTLQETRDGEDIRFSIDPRVPLANTHVLRVSTIYPTQLAINSSFNVEKVAAPILLQTL